jgi:hypothetical protein
MFEEVTNVCSYAAIVAMIYEVFTFLEKVTSGFTFIRVTVTTIRTTQVEQIGTFLFKVAQSYRGKSDVFGVDF